MSKILKNAITNGQKPYINSTNIKIVDFSERKKVGFDVM